MLFRDDQYVPVNIFCNIHKREGLLILEDPQAQYFFSQLAAVLGGVVGADAQKDEKPAAACPGDASVHGDAGLADALDACPHA